MSKVLLGLLARPDLSDPLVWLVILDLLALLAAVAMWARVVRKGLPGRRGR